MKNLITTLLLSLLFTVSQAQECGNFNSMKEGFIYTMKTFDKKDKFIGSVSYNLLKVEEGSAETKIQMECVYRDKKDKENTVHEVEILCSDGFMKTSLNQFTSVGTETLALEDDMTVEMEGTTFDIPLGISVGDKIRDSDFTTNVFIGDVKFLTTIVKVTDCKATAMKTVTTDAGDFECVVIEYNSMIKAGFVTLRHSNKVYFSKELGYFVKTEAYKNGKLDSYTILSEKV